jgi:hypothetical protein
LCVTGTAVATPLTSVLEADMPEKKQQPKTSKAKGRKGDPAQVSGISAAALEGAQEGAESSNNTERLARPGPGLPERTQARRGPGTVEPVESTAPESGTERQPPPEEPAGDASPDDFDDDLS